MGLLLRIHIALKAYLVKFLRTRETLKVFQAAHREELRETPFYNWPTTMARHSLEIKAIKAGKLDTIVDRKSWAWPFLPACASSDHEIFTKRGFIPVDAMCMEDVFATRNDSGQLEWQSPTAITKQRYKGEMIHAVGMNVDTLVTPNHRMLVRSKRFVRNVIAKLSHDKFVDALRVLINVNAPCVDNNRLTYEVPLTAKDHTPHCPVGGVVRLVPPKRNHYDHSQPLVVNVDTWIKFLALYLADGSCDGTTEGIEYGEGKRPFDQHERVFKKLLAEFKRDPHKVADRQSHNNYRVRISCCQSSAIRQEVTDLLASMPIGWCAMDQDFSCGYKALWYYLFPFGHSYTKYVPEWIKELPLGKLQLFFEWLKKTDGTEYSDERGEYSTCSKRFAEDVVYILIRLGYAVKVGEVQAVCQGVYSGATSYRIHFKRNAYGNIQTVESVQYDGFVYCPSVPNGTICLRRNGKVYWTGNSIQRLSVPVLKSTPYNIRRVSRTPVARRAMNLIKGAITSQPWDVRKIQGVDPIDNDDAQQERIRIAKKIFSHPNGQDSFQTFIEQGLEDMCILGAFVAELGVTLDPQRPLKMWPVNVESIRLFLSWAESTPDMPRYAQMTGLKGERGAILFFDDELLYIKENPSTDSPFGLGNMEVGFQSIIDLLGVQGMAGRAGTDAVHKTWLWWEQPQTDSAYQIVRRHIQNELEGQAKISIIGGMKKPEVIEVQPTVEADLLLNWQEMLIRMIANAFDMSAMALGIEHDVNRAVGEVLDDKDFRSAVVPKAKKLQEALTRKVLHNKLNWYDLEFVFLNLDDPDAQTKMDMFTRMYSTNSMTPNEIRRRMGMQPSKSPYADLTQFECMLINIQAMEMSQNNLADAGQQRQQDQMEQMQRLMPPQQEQQEPGTPALDKTSQPKQFPPPNQKQLPPGQQQKALPPGPQQPQGGKPLSPGQVSRGGQPPSPKALSLPKFPIAGSRYNARRIAQLPLNQMTDVFKFSGLAAWQFIRAMDEQEPGILEELTDEVKDFFKKQLEEEKKIKKPTAAPKLMKRWEKELGVKYRQENRRQRDYTSYLYKHGQQSGRPGGFSKTKPGKPGDINPVIRGSKK